MSNVTLGPAIPILDESRGGGPELHVDRRFQVDFRYERIGDYAGVRRDAVRLHGERQAPEHFTSGTAGRLRFRIPVNDPDALFAEFRAMGVLDDDVEVHETEWGTREFGFRDPDGNGLVFFRIL
jgi:uncharacterized glyoxalase superfamily protein PhnB